MDLSTRYLGFTLPHPLMPGASPLVDDLDTVKRLEDAGAAAIVMHSLFEEQITREDLGMVHDILVHEESTAEALSYFPRPQDFALGPDRYLEQVRRIKAAVGCAGHRIAERNDGGGLAELRRDRFRKPALTRSSSTSTMWRPTRGESGAEVERRVIDIVRSVKRRVTIPVAVKLSPFFSSLSHLAVALDEEGADGLVLFNRFYQPDVDPEMLVAVPRLHFSTSDELLLRVRWIAILYGRIRGSLAATGGRPHEHGRAQGDHGRRAGGPDGGRAPHEGPDAPRDACDASWRTGSRNTSTSRCARRKAV